MNYDLALIGAILASCNIAEAIKLGVKPRYLGGDAQAYWDILTEHYEQFHEVPSVEHFQAMCPSYEHNPPTDGLEAIVHELKTRYLHAEIDSALEKIAECNSVDPWEARTQLAQITDTLTLEVQRTNTDLVAGGDKADVLKRIELLRHNGGLLGYPWPWDFMNQQSAGVCPGNLIYFYGREKSKKTFLLCYLAEHFERLNLRVLFVTREMTMEEIAWRLYPMRVRLPYRELTAGQISSDGLLRLEDAMDDLYSRKNLIVTEMDGGMAGLRAKIDEVKPDVLIHDYMMAVAEDEMEASGKTREAEVIGKVAGDFKRLAMKLKIPVIACGHANRDGVKTKGRSSIEYAGSDKIVRRLDYGFRVISDDTTNQVALIMNAGRECKKHLGFTIDGTLCNGFGDFKTEDISWIEGVDAVQEDGSQRKRNKEDNHDIAPPPGAKLNVQSFTQSTRQLFRR